MNVYFMLPYSMCLLKRDIIELHILLDNSYLFSTISRMLINACALEFEYSSISIRSWSFNFFHVISVCTRYVQRVSRDKLGILVFPLFLAYCYWRLWQGMSCGQTHVGSRCTTVQSVPYHPDVLNCSQ